MVAPAPARTYSGGPMGRTTGVPYSSLTHTQILEQVGNAGPPQRPDMEEGRRQYNADVEAWHTTFGQLSPSLEQPYPLKPGSAPIGSGECYGCGFVTDPPHTGNSCATPVALQPHETRWRQLVGGMLRRAALPRANPAPVQYVWPGSPMPQSAPPELPVPIYWTAAIGENAPTEGEHDYGLTANWWEQGNFQGPPSRMD